MGEECEMCGHFPDELEWAEERLCKCTCHISNLRENDALTTLIIVCCVAFFFIVLLTELHVHVW